MVYEKYIKRGNKLHGPYYYESYRDETGKVKKKYLGTTKPRKNFNWLLLTGISFVLLISGFFALNNLILDQEVIDFNQVGFSIKGIAGNAYTFLTGFVAEEPVEESIQESSIETDSEETPPSETETTTETKSEAEETQTEEPEELIEEENETIMEIEEHVTDETIIPVINETLEEPATNETTGQNITIQNETITNITTGNETLEGNITVINQTILNETIANKTLEVNITETNITIQNETIINITTGNTTINTIQYDAVLGKPVKWKKSIKLDNAGENIRVEIPKEAENITVYKIGDEEEKEELNETIEEEQNNISVNKQSQQTVTDDEQQAETKKEKVSDEKIKITGKVISGEISAEINLEKEPKSFIADFFRKLFNRLTGKAVDVTETSDITETQEVKEVTINENSTEFEIEYETPAPVAYESNISAGKEIIISGPDALHYENILAFTELPREIPAESINNIKLYHIVEEIINITDNQSVNNEITNQITNIVKVPVNFDSYDTNNNSLVDYIEWLVPSLSNQTYQLIIVITKAEHLDSNRTFISDIYDEVKALDGNWSEAINNNEYVRVTFEIPLDNTRDITLYPRTISGTPRIEVYEINGNDLIAEFTTLTDNQYNKVYLTNLSECYDNETEILSDKGWKLFKDLDRSEKVLTLNPETNEKEWHKPYRYQTYEHNSEMYNIILEDGSELLVSPEHKVYAGGETQILRSFLNSSVLNIFTEDCFLKSGSLDQIAQLNFNASANIGISLSCVNCFALDSNCLNNSLGIISINPDSSDNTLLNCSELSLEYFNTSDLFFFNSSIEYCGEDNLNPIMSEFTIINLTGLSLKNESNIFVSTTNCISYHPSFLYLFHIPSLILSPSFKQSSSVSSEFSSILSNFLSNKALLTFSDKNLRIDSDTLSSGSSSNCFFNSSGMDKVMFGILLSPDILNSVYSVKDVQVYKSFSLQPITDVYSEFEDGENVYFLDSKNNPIKVKSITKEDYTGKIYDVTVDNHIILVKRHNSSAVWSGNSHTQDVFDLKVVDGSVEFEHIIDPQSGSAWTWNISSAVYVANISVTSIDNAPTGVFFNPNGTKMYITGAQLDSVYQFNVSDAWNVSSAVYDSIYINVTTQDTAPTGLFFKPDGTKMYLVGYTDDDVHQYTLSDAWNISSAVYDNVNTSLIDTTPMSLFFKSDGTKMYVAGDTNNKIYQFNLSDAWNVSSAVNEANLSVTNYDTAPRDVFFEPNGTKMYMTGNTNDKIYQFNLSVAWNVSSVINEDNLSVTNYDTAPYDLFFKSDGTKMYMTGNTGDRVFQYSLPSSSDSTPPTVTLNAPANNSYTSNSWNLLNSTIFNTNLSINMTVYIYANNNSNGLNASEGLVYIQENVANNTEINYNLTALPVKPSSNGLVSLYHFDNLSQFGENNTYVYDFSGNNNNLTCNVTGCPTWNATGKIAGAFNYTNHYFWANDSASFDSITQNITIMAWVNPIMNNQFQSVVSKNWYSAPNTYGSWEMRITDTGKVSCGFNISGSFAYLNSGNTININKWSFISCVYNGTTGTVFLNNASTSAASAGTLGLSDYNVSIGARYKDAQNLFNGTIDEVAIWNRSLSNAEILDLYRLGEGKYYWQVNASDGTLSNVSNVWQFTVDTIKPNINIITPLNNTNTIDNLLDVNYTVSDAGGISSCWYSNDSMSVNTSLTSSCNNITTITWANGQHNVTIWVNDTANSVNSSSVTFTVGASALSACSTLNAANSVYTLTQNITSTGTCIQIGANNITLNCVGYEINYSNAGTLGYGVNNTGYNLTTIKNCKIKEGTPTTSNKYAIYFSASRNGTIENNTITTSGSNGEGIYLTSNLNFNITSNIITTSGSNGYGVGLYSNFTTLISNTITTSGVTSHGINLYPGSNNNMTSNIITTSAGSSDGIYLALSSSNNIANNTITTSGDDGEGIYSWTNSHFNTMANNTITTSGDTSHGIWLDAVSLNSNVTSNTITTSGTLSHGIYLVSSSNSNITSNTIMTNGIQDYGIWLFSTSNSNINNNTITINGTNGRGIDLRSNSNNNTLTDNTVTTNGSSGYGIYLGSSSNNNSFSGMNIKTNSSESHGVYIFDTNHNFTIRDSIINSSLAQEFYVRSAVKGGEWNFTNITRANGNPIVVNWTSGGNGTLNMKWYLNAYSNNSAGSSLANVNVTSWDINNVYQFSNLTNSSGDIARQTLSEYQNINNTQVTYYSNYTFNATLTGYNNQSQSWNMTTNRNLVFTMTSGSDTTFPAINIIYPSNNTNTVNNLLNINYTASDTNLQACWYSNDSMSANTSLGATCTNITTVTWIEGQHNVTIWVNDTANNVNSTSVRFTIDTINPQINFTNPTPANASTQSATAVYVNVSTSDANNHSAFIDWNRSLVGWWNFDSVNSATGLVYDNSTWGNNGNITNHATNATVTGVRGKALQFDGINDYINISYNTVMDVRDGNKPHTINMWFKLNILPSIKNTHENLLSQRDGAGTGRSWIMVPKVAGAGYDADEIIVFGSGTSIGSNVIAVVNTWYFVTLQYNGTDFTVFVNGVQGDSSTISLDEGANGDFVVGTSKTSDNNFNGSIDEVMIFNRALTPQEINASYNAGAYRLFNNFTGLSDGTYNYTAHVIDIVGNINKTEQRSVTISSPDTTPPNVTINTPLNQTYNTNSIEFNVTALDETGISTCLYTLTNGITNYTMSNTSSIWNATNSTMSQGSSTVRFYCNDTTNNLNNSETRTFFVDSVNPKITIKTPTNNTKTINNLTNVNYTISDSGTGISSCWYSNDTMSVNTSLGATCANITTITWSEGQHNVTVWVNDTANNVNSTSVRFTVYNNTCGYALDGKPFITSVTNQSALVSMLFSENVDYLISYGSSTGVYTYNSSIVLNNPINISAEVYLTNLTPDSTWFYRPYIRKNATSEAYCAVFTERNFTTQKSPGNSFVFDFITDSHWWKAFNYNQAGLPDFTNITNFMLLDNPDFVVEGGDTAMTHDAGATPISTQAVANNRYHLTRNEYASRVPFPIYYVLGNHESEFDFNGTGGHNNTAMNLSMTARLGLWPGPTNNTYSYGGSNDTYNGQLLENYYAFDYGDATFIILDVMRYNSITGPQTANEWTYGQNQFEWVNRTLATSTKKWKFVFAHHIAGGINEDYNIGYEYGDGGGNYSKTGNETYGQVALNPLMERYNAQFFVYGHSHFFNLDWANWSAYNLTKSVNYVLSSTATQTVCTAAARNNSYDSEICKRGHTKFEVSPNNVTFYFINATDGVILFNYTVLNTPPNINANYTNNTNVASNLTFTYSDNEYDTAKNCSMYVNNSLAYTKFDLTNGSSVVLNLSEDLGLSIGQQFNWYINCSDGALSNQTMLFTSTVASADSTQPNVTINTPLNQTYNTNSIEFNVTALDETGMSTCLYTLTNGLTNYTMSNTSSIWNATNSTMSQGSSTVRFYCNDTSNNLNNSETKTFVVDSINPQINLTYPLNITYTSVQTAINFTASDTNLNTCWYSANNGQTNTTTSCTTNITGLSSNQGSNTWLVGVNDTANNKNMSAITFFVDSINPQISITYPTNNTNSSNTLLNINYTASDSGGISSCWYSNDSMSLNTSLTSSCTNITTVTWAEGQHNVTIWVNDTVNNVNSSSVRFTINTSALTQCGTLSTVNSTYTLAQNITSTGTCITIGANNITLNCQGYEINYSSAGTLGYGINNTGYNLTTIKNCKIKEGKSATNAKYAIYFSGANNGTIENNTITTSGGTGHGIYGSSTSNSNISGNIITISGVNGIGIYLISSSNSNSIISNTITTSGGNGNGISLLTNSNSNTLNNNTITTSGDDGYGIASTSNSNTLNNNTITTSGADSYGIYLNTKSDNNTFSGTNIQTNSSTGYGIYIYSLHNNFTIKDSIINCSLTQEFYVGNQVKGGEFNFTNVTRANGNPIVVNWTSGGNGTLNMKWYLNAYTNYTNGTVAINSNVSAWDKNNVYQFSNLTNSSGDIARQILSEYQNINNTQVTYYSNYTFNATLTGYTTQTQSWNMTTNRNLVFTMAATDSTPPNVTINTPLNQTYNTNSIEFNVTTLDETGMGTCLYTLTNGITNYTMSNTSSIWNATNSTMSQGSQTVRFYCNDTSNNFNNSETKTFVVDTVNPQINLTYPLNITYTSVQTAINFTASDTNLNTCWYSANNGQTNTTTSCTTNITGLSSNQGSNTWLVGVNDTANNKNMSAITFFVDSINPQISITTPLNNTNSSNNLLNINYTASDSGGISSCWYSNDSMSLNTSLTSSCTNITTVTWAEGQHNVTIWVNDTVNNVNSSSVRFTIDTLPPYFTNWANQTITTSQSLNYDINAADDGVGLGSFAINWTSTFSIVSSTGVLTNISGLSVSLYYINVSVNDTLGNLNSSILMVNVTSDSTPPVITLISPADAYSSTDTSVTYQYNVTDASSTNCSLILDGAIINFNSSVNVSGGTNTFTNTTSVASHTWSINCTDNANNIANSSSRAFTITSSAVTPPTSPGGGGTVTPTTTKTFSLDKEQTSVKLKQGETKELEFVVTNTGTSSLNVYVNSSIKEMMNIAEPNISLAVGESKTIVVDVIAKEDKTPDIYLGKIYVKSGSMTKEILVSIEVVSKESLFDIVLEIPKKYQDVSPGEEISFKVSLTRMIESDRKDVTINYTIKDEEGNLITYSEDTKAIETSMSYVKEIKMPEETKYGKYVLYVQVIYEGKVASASQWFNVGEKSKFTGIIFWVVIIVILITGIVFIISIIYSKYIKKNNKVIEKDN